MSNRIHALAQQLTGKFTVDECSVEEIQHIAKRYPYFAPAQFLLLQKLKQSNASEAEEQSKKAVLFYHDPLLFDYFISSEKFYVDEASLFAEKAMPASFELVAGKEESVVTGTESFDIPENTVEAIEVDETSHEEIAEVMTDAVLPTNNIEEETNQPEQSAQQSHEDFMRSGDEEPSEPGQDETVEEEIVLGKISLPQLNKEMISPAPTETELSFEPFHTVDYFASQGIKISQEELPKDKLGKQLKSFTAWLKTMKRLPATSITGSAASSAEQRVESMADHSITESEVVTEAMAEVWAKQGAHGKAIEIYNKLSLLNPSKRAYFAAKIENLKQS